MLSEFFPEPSDVPRLFLKDLPCSLTAYLANGELIKWDGPKEQVFSPVWVSGANECSPMFLGEYPQLSENEALEALQSAEQAYDHGKGVWPTMRVAERIHCVERFVSEMVMQKERVAQLLMWEVGKSLQDSVKEFDRTVSYINDTIDALKDLDRACSRFVVEQGVIGQIRRGPLGVVLCMGPFNYPLNETLTTLIPALIMGNSVILKPPKHGALLYEPLLGPFQRNFPKGVVNILFGQGRKIITPLMASGRVNVLALIGNSRTANTLKKLHPQPNRLRCVLGLEAKNPAIVLNDADLENAVHESVLGALTFNGQRCTAIKIIFVESGIAEAYMEKLSHCVNTLKMGMPWEENVVITPVAEKDKTNYLSELVNDAVALGASVVNTQGASVRGAFFFPAVVYPVNAKMRLFLEEQFGPIVPIVKFDDINEPLEYMIQSNYGQQVSLFGQDPDRLSQLIDPLVNQVCRVNLNSQCQRGPDTFPFAGRKDSAEGTLSVSDALRVFSIRTLVAAKATAINKRIITDITTQRRSRFLSTDYIF